MKRVMKSLDYVTSLDPEIAEAVQQSNGVALNYFFEIMLGIACLALLGACFVKKARSGRFRQ